MALSPSTKKYLQQRFFIRRVIFGGFIMSILMFGTVLYIQGPNLGKQTQNGDSYKPQESQITYGEGKASDQAPGVSESGLGENGGNSKLPMMLGLIALLNIVMAFVLPMILAKQLNYDSLKERPIEDFLKQQKDRYGNPIWTEKQVATIKDLPKNEQFIYVLSNGTFVSNIIQWALFESVAIMGFVAATTTGKFSSFLPFAATALVLLFLTAPMPGLIEKKASRMLRKY